MAILPERMQSARLVLRRPRTDDARGIFDGYARDPEVTRYMDWSPHETIAHTVKFLGFCDEGWNGGTELSWAITVSPSDRVVGMISMRPKGHKADFGYVLAREHWGKGLITEAGRVIVDAAFSLSQMRRLWAACDVENAASARVLEKLGLTREGTLRAWGIHPNLSAEPRDALVYAMTRREFETTHRETRG